MISVKTAIVLIFFFPPRYNGHRWERERERAILLIYIFIHKNNFAWMGNCFRVQFQFRYVSHLRTSFKVHSPVNQHCIVSQTSKMLMDSFQQVAEWAVTHHILLWLKKHFIFIASSPLTCVPLSPPLHFPPFISLTFLLLLPVSYPLKCSETSPSPSSFFFFSNPSYFHHCVAVFSLAPFQYSSSTLCHPSSPLSLCLPFHLHLYVSVSAPLSCGVQLVNWNGTGRPPLKSDWI